MLTDSAINLLVFTIRDLVLGGEEEIETFSSLLKADIILASDKGDVDFINKVIVPILHAEEKIPITISTIDESALKKGEAKLRPIYAAGEAATSGSDNFFLKTTILSKKQKGVFAQKFKELSGDKVENFGKMMDSKWDLIFEDKAHQN